MADLQRQIAELQAANAQYQQTIEALSRSEELTRALLESASDGIVIVDREGRIILINARALEMFGYSRKELLGRPIETLLPERFHAVHVAHRAGFSAHPRLRPMGKGYDLVARRRDGSEFPVEVSLSFVRQGDVFLIMSFITDVTERKKIEDEKSATLTALQKRNRDLALLNRVSQTLTATLDSQEVVERLLQTVTEAIGAVGSSVWLWDPHEQGWLVCKATFHEGRNHLLVNRRLAAGQGVAGWVAQHGESVVVPYAPADPRYNPEIDAQTGFQTTSLLSMPLRVRDRIIGVLQVVNKAEGGFDVDDQALVETLAASAAIAIENAQLVEALREQARQLQARNEELDAFAHTAAHDLKNPLGIMVGFATALEDQYVTLEPGEMVRYLRIIAQNGRKATNIIDELLLLAGVRKTEARLHPLDMASIVAEAQARLTDLIQEYQAELSVPQQWPTAMGYAAWVEEVWVNYISNAIRYGGRPPRVELGFSIIQNPKPVVSEANLSKIHFWVRDNGPGISLQDQSRLFTPFTQMHQVRTEGHGLGLSIVRRIVIKLGGQVGVESQVGQGSSFYFTLPAADPLRIANSE